MGGNPNSPGRFPHPSEATAGLRPARSRSNGKPDTGPLRLALLARTSTEDQQDPTISIPRQLRTCENALPDGVVIVAHYYDIESGRKDLALRGRSRAHEAFDIPVRRDGGIADLLEAAESGNAQFDGVICESIDRIARRTYYGTLIEHRLERAGIVLLAADEPIILTGRRGNKATQILTRRVKQGVAEWYVLDMLEKAWGGFEQHTEQGFNVGIPPYGYRAERIPHPVPARRAEGKTKTRLALDRVRAPIVAKIYQWRVTLAMGYEVIAEQLNSDLTLNPPPVPPDPARAKGYWTSSAVRDILHNPKYTGYMVWNRRATKSGGRVNAASDWVWSPEPTHPAIVSVDTYLRSVGAAQRRERVREAPGANSALPHATQVYPFRSFVWCSKCGLRMNGRVRRTTHYYACAPKKSRVDAPHRSVALIREDALQSIVSKFFALRILGSDRFLLAAEALGAGESTAQTERAARLTAIQQQISDRENRRRKLMRSLEIADEVDDEFVRDIQSRIAEVRAEKRALQEQLKAVEKTVSEQENPNLLDTLPFGEIDVSKLPEELQRRLYDVFRLEIHYDFETRSVKVSATVFFEALGIARNLADQAIRISSGKETTGLVEDSTGPVCSVPPVGFEPTHPPPEGGALSPELRGLGT